MNSPSLKELCLAKNMVNFYLKSTILLVEIKDVKEVLASVTMNIVNVICHWLVASRSQKLHLSYHFKNPIQRLISKMCNMHQPISSFRFRWRFGRLCFLLYKQRHICTIDN